MAYCNCMKHWYENAATPTHIEQSVPDDIDRRQNKTECNRESLSSCLDHSRLCYLTESVFAALNVWLRRTV